MQRGRGVESRRECPARLYTNGKRPATLRGLGPLRSLGRDQVWALVNGTKRHNSALLHVLDSVGRVTAGTDMNAISIGAIERIEVLRDGASAQYGSDAIAGVINLVLKNSPGFISLGRTCRGDGMVFTHCIHGGFANENGASGLCSPAIAGHSARGDVA